MAKDFADINRLEHEAGIQAPEASTKDELVNKFVKAWENQTARRVAKGGTGLTMALTLAACGSDSSTPVVSTSGETDGEDESVAGEAVTLTTGVDDLTGTDGADTFNGVQTGGDDETFSAFDAIAAGEGVDVLKVTNTEAAALNIADVTGIEEIVYRSVGGGGDIDMANFDGATKLTLDRSVGLVNVDNFELGTTLVITDAGATQDTTVTYAADSVTGTADAGTLTLDGARDGADVVFAGAIETFTLTASGDASRLADFVLPGTVTALTVNASADLRVDTAFTAVALETLTLIGAGDVRIDAALAATVETVSAGTATGGITLIMGAADQTITTGAGDDVIDMQRNLDADDTINLGAGANTLRIDANGQAAGVTDLSITNVQTFRFDNMAANNGAINMDNLTPTTIRLDAAQAVGQADTTGVLTLTDLASTVASFSLIGAGADGAASDDVSFNGLTIDYDVTTDVSDVTIVVNNGGTVADDIFVGALVMDNVESLEIRATNIGQAADDELTIADINGDALETLTIVADGEVIITDIDSAEDDVLELLDLSGVTAGGVTVTTISGHAAEFTITGSGFNDDITNGNTAGDVTVNLGAGNDRYVSNVAADTITTGAGVDTIVFIGNATDDLNIITDFTAGLGGDIIDFATSAVDAQSGITTGASTFALIAADTTVSTGLVVVDNDALANDAASLSTADVAAYLADLDGAGDVLDAHADGDDDFYIVVSDGTDTGVFLYVGTGDATIDAGELTLIVTLEGVSDAGILTASNFADFI